MTEDEAFAELIRRAVIIDDGCCWRCGAKLARSVLFAHIAACRVGRR